MKRKLLLLALLLSAVMTTVMAQQRRPIDNRHPMWLVHIDVWNQADPQKIIDLIPEDIRPYVVMNLSLSCSFKTEDDMYERPRYAVRTYKSWASVCQHNNMFFTCQPASGGHTHIQDTDLETFEYFFKTYPNFLGWNYAEQFWGFNVANNKSSSTEVSRWALFAKLVEMSHKYGGFLTVSWCGGVYHMGTNPIAELKRNKDFLAACKAYPEAILFLYKYTHCSSFYNNESVCWGPFVSGLTKNYGVRYDNCGWNDMLSKLLGENHGKKYPGAAGIGTVMEQTCVNGGAVWDGPELIWSGECFQNQNNSTVDGYTRRNWGYFPNFRGIWMDMWREIIKGRMYIPTREEILEKTKIVVINDKEGDYTAWDDLYNGLYLQTDPGNQRKETPWQYGQWQNNLCYFKSTGRYGAIPIVTGLYDEAAKAIPVQVKKSSYTSRWGTLAKKQADFNAQYPEVSKGDLYVNRYKDQLVCYTPYTYLNSKKRASAAIPLAYNTCDTLKLDFGKLSGGIVREYEDRIELYLNNYRADSTAKQTDKITIVGVSAEPTFRQVNHKTGATGQSASYTKSYDADAKAFTLNVSHLGAVDVVINCKGTRQGKAPELPSEALPLPQQPADVVCPVIIEAENMDYKNIQELKLTPNWGYAPEVKEFAGLGFIRMGSNTASSLRHQLKLKTAGSYTLKVRYCEAAKAGTMNAVVNGVSQPLTIEKCALNDWHEATVSIELKAGTNDLKLNNVKGIAMMIDQIIYEPAGTPAEKFKVTVKNTADGVITADVDSAAKGQTVTLTVVPAEGHSLKELHVINSIYYTQGWSIPFTAGATTVTFVMPDDNVTLQPVYNDDNAVYILDYSKMDNATFPVGWRTTDGTDVRNYPYSNSSGPRGMTGFQGFQGKALYWRNTSAEYGRLAAYPLTLEPGDYILYYAMAAWKATPQYQASIVNSATNAVVKSGKTVTAAPNVNGDQSGSIASATVQELPFTITKQGNYVIKFTDKSTFGGLHEFLLAECRIRRTGTTGIVSAPVDDVKATDTVLYGLDGRPVIGTPRPGIYIRGGRKVIIK